MFSNTAHSHSPHTDSGNSNGNPIPLAAGDKDETHSRSIQQPSAENKARSSQNTED